MESEFAAITLSPWEPGILSLGLYVLMVFAMIGVFLFLCSWPGERKETPEKQRPYECGIIPTGTVRFRYPVPFYMIAIFFLIFDVEAAYIFTWAVAFEELGWMGWAQICFFITILLFSLFYIWNKGGLDWRRKASDHSKRRKTSS